MTVFDVGGGDGFGVHFLPDVGDVEDNDGDDERYPRHYFESVGG